MTEAVARLNAALEDRYRIAGEIGRGGMATVYVADDLRHQRQVAIKVLEAELVAQVGADRFLAEIKTTANLQHRSILPLFDSGEADGFPYYVMPFVEGESLRERLDRERQLPVEDAVRIASDVADALTYAHGQGVVHRDIKPENILLRQGQALVADFGIALALQAGGGGRLTETGFGLGTPLYMSPEQATGEPIVGPRSDIYALGCVLYEMLVGEPPYAGSTAQAVLGKIIMGTLEPVTERRPSVPGNVDAAIRRALEKVPADRFPTASQFAGALADADFRHGPPSESGTVGKGRTWPYSATLVVVALLVTVIGLWGWLWMSDASSVHPVRLSVSLPLGEQPWVRFWESPVAISPDGRTLAYTATRGGLSGLYLRDLDDFEVRLLPGTEGAQTPFFSPDGLSVGFIRAGRVWSVAVAGGAPLPFGDVSRVRFGATWGPDGNVYVGGEGGLLRLSGEGGSPEVISPIDADSGEIARGFPQVLSNGLVLLSVFASSGNRVEVLDPSTGDTRVVLEDAVGARYVPTGHLVFGWARVMQAVAFDVSRMTVTSSRISLTDDVRITAGGTPQIGISDNGTLVYVPSGTLLAFGTVGLGASGTGDLVRVSPEQEETVLWQDWPGAGRVRLSPDGTRAVDAVPAESGQVGSNFHVWAFDLVRRTSIPLTSEGTNVYPIWAPGGSTVFYSSNLTGPMSLYVVPADGSADPRPLLVRDQEQFITHWSSDGLLAYSQIDPTTGNDVWLLPLDGSGEPRPFLNDLPNEAGLVFSPDGHWVAYWSDASGRPDVYLQPFPGPGPRTLVSTDGGTLPRWADDGRHLYYRHENALWGVAVQTEPTLAVGPPDLVLEGAYAQDFDVDPQGQGFVLLKLDPPTTPTRFHVVQNWLTELEALLPR